jgi:hypothetical protein
MEYIHSATPINPKHSSEEIGTTLNDRRNPINTTTHNVALKRNEGDLVN